LGSLGVAAVRASTTVVAENVNEAAEKKAVTAHLGLPRVAGLGGGLAVAFLAAWGGRGG